MMRRIESLALLAALAALATSPVSLAEPGGDTGTSAEVEEPAAPQVGGDGGYRPRWADPNAPPPMPGIENEPTPFNPADVDANSDTLNNNIDVLGQ